MSENKPLSRFKVLDLTAHRAGPTAARQLADWGADVIKVEQPKSDGDGMGGARHGFDFQNLHRNKRSITLDLKKGRDVFLRLAEKADVVLENFRPDVKHRLKIDYDVVSKVNPRIVYGSISGFGQSGPYRDRPGVDQIAQGLGGLMSVTGLPGQGPVRIGIAICDLTAGIFLAQGVLVALLERERSGKGQWVHTSLLEAMISMLDFQATRWTMGKEIPPQAGNMHPTGVPTGVFKTKDSHINVQAGGQNLYERMCNSIGAQTLITDERFKSPKARQKNRDVLMDLLAPYFLPRTSDEWIIRLNDAGVPSGPILTIDQTFADPQVVHMACAQKVHSDVLGDLELVGHPVNTDAGRNPIYMPAPERGANNVEVYGAVGIGKDELAKLKASGTI